MKKFLASFLIAFMVAMPVLACCCPQDNQADTHANHQHHDEGSTSNHSEQDCSKVDLQVSNQIAGVQSSDLQSKIHFDYAYVSNHSVWTLALLSDNTRNTLFTSDPPHNTLPVFLTTQRLRI